MAVRADFRLLLVVLFFFAPHVFAVLDSQWSNLVVRVSCISYHDEEDTHETDMLPHPT